MSTFRVVLTGKLLPGHELDQVKQQISKMFNLADDSEHLSMMLGGSPLIVKSRVSQSQAQAYQKAIIEAGLECQVVAEGTAAVKSSSSGEEVSTEGDQAESSEADAEIDEIDVLEPKKLSVGSGLSWIKEGFHYFKMKPIVWIGMVIVLFLISALLSMIPVVSLFENVIMSVFIGGLMLACYKLYRGENIGVGDLFGGFHKNTKTLMIVGAIYTLGIILLVAVGMGAMFALGDAGGMMQMAQSGHMDGPPPQQAMLVILLVFALMIPLIMAYYFAPALVVMHDMTAREAMKLSFKGCLRNFIPFIVYGLTTMVLIFVAAIPLGLGMLVMFPVIFASNFAAYRQIFTATETP